MHARTQARTHARARARAHTHTHTHTHTRARNFQKSSALDLGGILLSLASYRALNHQIMTTKHSLKKGESSLPLCWGTSATETPSRITWQCYSTKARSFLLSKLYVREQLNSSTWQTACLSPINTLDWRAAVYVPLDQWSKMAKNARPFASGACVFLFTMLAFVHATHCTNIFGVS